MTPIKIERLDIKTHRWTPIAEPPVGASDSNPPSGITVWFDEERKHPLFVSHDQDFLGSAFVGMTEGDSPTALPPGYHANILCVTGDDSVILRVTHPSPSKEELFTEVYQKKKNPGQGFYIEVEPSTELSRRRECP